MHSHRQIGLLVHFQLVPSLILLYSTRSFWESSNEWVQKGYSAGENSKRWLDHRWSIMWLNFFPNTYILYSTNLTTKFIMASEVIKKEVVNIYIYIYIRKNRPVLFYNSLGKNGAQGALKCCSKMQWILSCGNSWVYTESYTILAPHFPFVSLGHECELVGIFYASDGHLMLI